MTHTHVHTYTHNSVSSQLYGHCGSQASLCGSQVSLQHLIIDLQLELGCFIALLIKLLANCGQFANSLLCHCDILDAYSKVSGETTLC